MNALYLLINICVLSIPLAFSWHPRLRFVDRWGDFARACTIVLVCFVAWDIVFTRMGIWGFDGRYHLGFRIAGLPIEELLFFVCIPYACLFTYHSLRVLDKADWLDSIARPLLFALAGLVAVLFALNAKKIYTATTLLLILPLLMWLLWQNPPWFGQMLVAYLILCIPFVLTNGLLTGITFWNYPVLNLAPDGIVDHVVWYDNTQNMAVRFSSIPFDDFFYFFLMFGLNVSLFEFFGSR